jgi:hypothetical protein
MVDINDDKLRAKYAQDVVASEGRIKDLREELLEIDKGSTEEARKQLELIKEELAIAIKTKELEQIELKNKQQLSTLTAEELERLKQISSELEVQRKSSKDKIKQQEKIINLLEQEDRETVKIKNNILGAVSAEEMKLTSLRKVWDVTQKMSTQEARSTLLARLQEVGLGTLVLAEKFNQVTAELNKATNTSGKYDDVITSVISSNIRFGIGMEEAARAIQDLNSEFSSFSGMNEQTQTDLTEFTAKMDKAGISSQTTSKFLNIASLSMGMGAKETMKYQKELFAFARANSISTKAISDGLASVMPRLAAFGKQGPEIFKNLAFQAKSMGVEMGKVLDVTEKFTTFEGAAEAAGELNSVLGGNLIDTLGLLKAANEDPVEATNMLRNALQSTGKSFDELTGAQRRMFASIIGQDLETTAGYFKQTSEQAKSAADAENTFNDAVASFIPIGEKLKNLVSALAPAFKVFSTILGGVVDVLAGIASNPIVSFFISAVAAVAAAGASFVALKGIFLTFIGTLGMLKTALFGASTALSSTGNILPKIASKIGAGVRTFFTSIGQGIASLGATLTAAAPQIFIGIVLFGLFSLAVLILSAGVYVLAMAFKMVLDALVPFVQTLIDGGSASLTAALAFAILAGSFSLMAVGLLALGTVGLLGIAALLVLVPLVSSLGDSFKNIGEGFANAKLGIDSLIGFDTSKLENIKDNLSLMADQMERLANAAIAFSLAMANPVLMPIMATALATQGQTGAVSAINKTSAGTNTGGSAGGPITANITIEMPIQIDGKQIEKKIVKKIVQLKYNNNNELSNTEGSTSTIIGAGTQ